MKTAILKKKSDRRLETRVSILVAEFMILIHRGAIDQRSDLGLYGPISIESFYAFTPFFTALRRLDRRVQSARRAFQFWFEHASEELHLVTCGGMSPLNQGKLIDQKCGDLVFVADGEFELRLKDEILTLGLSRFYYSQESKSIELDEAQKRMFFTQGPDYLRRVLEPLRLFLWDHLPVWAVLVLACIESNQCSIAFDDSPYYLAYYLGPAKDRDDAINRIGHEIHSDFMRVEKIYEVRLFDELGLDLESEFGAHISAIRDSCFWKQTIGATGVSVSTPVSFSEAKQLISDRS